MKRIIRNTIFPLILLLTCTIQLAARQMGTLSLDSAVQIAMENSYQIKRLKNEIQSEKCWVKSWQASLKSKVYMNLKSPELSNLSDYKWNSTLYKDEIVKQNTRKWQADLTVKQPVILLGYPTNGYFSLNYRIYRYDQMDDGRSSFDYYNRLFLEFEQPFFLPNTLKNEIESAALNLEDAQLDYLSESIEILEDISKDYFYLVRLANEDSILTRQLSHLHQIDTVLTKAVQKDPSVKIDQIRNRLEISNTTENLLEVKSNYRMALLDFKQQIGLNANDSIQIKSAIQIMPSSINPEEAIDMCFSINPEIKEDLNRKRRAELELEDEKGRNALHAKLRVTYGLEKKNHHLRTIWERYDNSNSVTVNAYIPIWDWKKRELRINARELEVARRELDIEESKKNLRRTIRNACINIREYQTRTFNMLDGREMAAQLCLNSINKLNQNNIQISDLLQIVNKQKETEMKLIDVYIDYKKAMLSLMVNTYYDYENRMTLLKKLDILGNLNNQKNQG